MGLLPHGDFSGRRLFVVGCGYVGSAIAAQARRAGMEVAALTRNAVVAARLRESGVNVLVADAASDAWHAGAPQNPEFVLNCLSSGGGGVEGYRHSYLEGMRSVLRWARSAGGVGTFVYTSSTSVYQQGGGVRVTETSSLDEDGASTGQGLFAADRTAILRETERELMRSESACARWFILRLAGIYGPGRHGLIDQVRSGVVSGTGESHLNLAHQQDIVAAILTCFAAASSARNEVFNVADDHPTRKAEIVRWLAQQLHVPEPTFSGLAAPGRQRLTPDRLIINTKLKTTLGWTPLFPSYREGYGGGLKAHRIQGR